MNTNNENILGYDAFISHSSQDKKKAYKICESLEERGLKIWIAPRDIRPGRQYGEEITYGVRLSRCLVILLSKSANESVNVAAEAEEARKAGIPIFPVRIEGVQPSSKLSFYVSATQWIDAWSGSLLDHVDALASSLKNYHDDAPVTPLKSLSNQRNFTQFLQRNVAAIIAAIGIVVLGIITTISVLKKETVISDETRGKTLESVSELEYDDLFINGMAMLNYSKLEGPHTYHLSIGPSTEYATMVLRSASYKIALDDGEFNEYERFMKNEKSLTLAGYQSFNIEAPTPPGKISIEVIGPKGKTAGPFTYEMDFKSQIKESLGQLKGMTGRTKTINSSLVKKQLSEGRKIRISDFIGAGTTLSWNTGNGDINSMLKRISLGNDEHNLAFDIYPGDSTKNRGVAFSSRGRKENTYLIPVDAHKLYGQLEFSDGEILPLSIHKPNRWGKNRPYFQMKSKSEEAPVLLAYPVRNVGLYPEGGEWGFVPFVGEEVSKIEWSTFEGGSYPVEERDGFFLLLPRNGDDLGIQENLSNSRLSTPIMITYHFSSQNPKTYSYLGSWKDWVQELSLSQIEYDELLKCSDRLRRNLRNLTVGEEKTVEFACSIKTNEPASTLISDVFWGLSPKKMTKLQGPDHEEIIEKNRKIRSSHYDKQQEETTDERMLALQQDRKLNALNTFEKEIRRELNRSYVSWRSDGYTDNDYFLMSLEPADILYFKLHLVDGSYSPVLKVRVK